MRNEKLLFITEIAIFTALALLLDYISNILSLQIWAQGGSISFAMIPIFIIAFRWGIKGGLTVGLLTGTLQLIIGFATIIHPFQAVLDYILAYSLLGVSGVFFAHISKAVVNKNNYKIWAYTTVAIFIGSLLRFLCHYASGIIFFREYAPAGTPAELYSLVYNASYMFPSFLISSVIIAILLSMSTVFIKSRMSSI